MLLLPDKKDPTHVKPFQERKLLFRTLKESEEWGKEIGIETVGDLNDQICRGSLSELILVQEARRDCQEHRRQGRREICHDRRTLFFRQDQFFPQIIHSVEDPGENTASHCTGRLFREQRIHAKG